MIYDLFYCQYSHTRKDMLSKKCIMERYMLQVSVKKSFEIDVYWYISLCWLPEVPDGCI